MIAPHGGSLTNIVFCNKKAKIIELFSPKYIIDWYRHISNHVGFEHCYLIGKGERIPKERSNKNADILIDTGELKRILELVGIKT